MPVISLIVDTKDRIRGTPNDFTVVLPRNLKDVSRLSLVGMTMPQSAYTVNSTNKVIKVDIYDAGNNITTSTNVSLDEGIYDATSLAQELQSKFNTVANFFTVVYDESALKFIITIGNGLNFSLRPSSLWMKYLLGFGSDIIYSVGGTYTSDKIAIINTPTIYYIKCRQINNSVLRCSRTNQYETTFYVMANNTPPDTQVIDFRYRPQTITFSERMNLGGALDFELVDEYNQTLFNLGDFTMILEVNYEN